MKKASLILWSLLTLYTLTYVFSYGFQSNLLPQLLQGQADGFSTFFFNWMGLVPFYFLIDASLDENRTRLSWIPIGLSFIFGAYSLLWGYRNLSGKRLKLTTLKSVMISILIMVSGWFMLDAIMMSNPSVYFSLFSKTPWLAS